MYDIDDNQSPPLPPVPPPPRHRLAKVQTANHKPAHNTVITHEHVHHTIPQMYTQMYTTQPLLERIERRQINGNSGNNR